MGRKKHQTMRYRFSRKEGGEKSNDNGEKGNEPSHNLFLNPFRHYTSNSGGGGRVKETKIEQKGKKTRRRLPDLAAA